MHMLAAVVWMFTNHQSVQQDLQELSPETTTSLWLTKFIWSDKWVMSCLGFAFLYPITEAIDGT